MDYIHRTYIQDNNLFRRIICRILRCSTFNLYKFSQERKENLCTYHQYPCSQLSHCHGSTRYITGRTWFYSDVYKGNVLWCILLQHLEIVVALICSLDHGEWLAIHNFVLYLIWEHNPSPKRFSMHFLKIFALRNSTSKTNPQLSLMQIITFSTSSSGGSIPHFRKVIYSFDTNKKIP